MKKQDIAADIVRSHANIGDEPMEAAIWIRQDETAIWLVELLPNFSDDDDISSPTVFSAGKDIRYDLYLIAGNERSLRRGIASDRELAEWIASGTPLHGKDKAAELQKLAQLASGSEYGSRA